MKNLVLLALMVVGSIVITTSSASASPLYIGGAGGPPTAPGGGGSVTSNDGSITCGADCTGDLQTGQSVVLTFNPGPGTSFTQWSLYAGTCAEGITSPVCTFVAGSAGSFAAQPAWHYNSYTVSVVKTGTGTGTVTGSGINCGSTCSVTSAYSGSTAAINLVATPSAGSIFEGWEADSQLCAGSVGGKGAAPIINPSPTCAASMYYSSNGKTAKARFTKSATSTTTASTGTTKPGASSSQSAPSTTATPNTPANGTPSVPVAEVKIDDKVVAAGEKPVLEFGKKLVLSGKTVPNGIVTIYVFSEPKKYSVTADKDGNWTYAVADLPSGDHHVEAEVTDPATGKTSTRAQVLAFSVARADSTSDNVSTAENDTPAAKTNKTSLRTTLIAATTSILVITCLGLLVLWKFKPHLLTGIVNRIK